MGTYSDLSKKTSLKIGQVVRHKKRLKARFEITNFEQDSFGDEYAHCYVVEEGVSLTFSLGKNCVFDVNNIEPAFDAINSNEEAATQLTLDKEW